MMRYTADVRGSQPRKPADIEFNGSRVYARSGIRQVAEDCEGESITMWAYEEAEFSTSEWHRMLELDSSWVTEWSAPLRTAERRARYERMDPIVSKLRRLIDLGIDADANCAKLQAVQTYCKAVTDTQRQASYPTVVDYPEEPEVRWRMIGSRSGVPTATARSGITTARSVPASTWPRARRRITNIITPGARQGAPRSTGISADATKLFPRFS